MSQNNVPAPVPQSEDADAPVSVIKIGIQLTPAVALGLRRIEKAIAKARADLGDDVIPDEKQIYLGYFL